MKIGYGKLGRTMTLDPKRWGPVGGDNEPHHMLIDLATRNPEHEFHIIGRNSGENPEEVGLPSNVVNPWTEWKDEMKKVPQTDIVVLSDAYISLTNEYIASMDGIVLWVGQHGTSNSPTPTVEDRSINTKPQISFINYAGFLLHGINTWRDANEQREEVWLHADPRNYNKGRDLKWPTRKPMLAQFDWSREQKHERWGDPRSPRDFDPPYEAKWDGAGVWLAKHRYCYSQLETTGIPVDVKLEQDFGDRAAFGVIVNEARSYVKIGRKEIVRDWVLPLEPAFLYGKWSDASLEELGVDIQPIHYLKFFETQQQAKSTLTTPSSGSGWATAKPWECFSLRTVCFFHPDYDTQGHIIPTLKQVKRGEVMDEDLEHLAKWLRPQTPDELATRVKAVNESYDTWEWLTDQQWKLWQRAVENQACITEIERRVGIGDGTQNGRELVAAGER